MLSDSIFFLSGVKCGRKEGKNKRQEKLAAPSESGKLQFLRRREAAPANLLERYFLRVGEHVVHIFVNADDLDLRAAPAQEADEAREIAQAGAADAAQILQLQEPAFRGKRENVIKENRQQARVVFENHAFERDQQTFPVVANRIISSGYRRQLRIEANVFDGFR